MQSGNRRAGAVGVALVVFGGAFILQCGGFLAFMRGGGEVQAAAVLGAGARALLWLSVASCFSVGMIGAGTFLLDAALGPSERYAWKPIAGGTVGLAATSSLVLLSGVVGVSSRGFLAGALVSLCGVGALFIARAAVERTPVPTGRSWPRWKGAVAGLLGYLTFCAVARALVPPIDIDVLKYHLALPKLYLGMGAVVDLPWNVFSHWPQAMEMLYALGLASGSDALPALMHTGVCAVLVAATFLVARDEFGDEAAVAAAVILAVQPCLIREAGAAMNDGLLSLFYLVACAALRRWERTGDRYWLRLGASAAGASAAVKFHGLILLLGLFAWAAARSFRDDRSRALRMMSSFVGWAALFSAPWYLKSWIVTGNPVWPFMTRVFGGKWGAAAIASAWSPKAALDWRLRLGQWDWILFGEGAVYLLAPASAAVIWVVLRGRAFPRALAVFLAPLPLYALVSATSISIWRYLLPFFAPLSMVVAWGLFGGEPDDRPPGRPAALAFIGGLCLASVIAGRTSWGPNNELYPLLGVRSRRYAELNPREAYLRHSLPAYAFVRAVNSALKPGDRLFVAGENQGYYLDVDYMLGDPSEQAVVDYDRIPDPAALHAELRRLGVTHLAISRQSDWYVDLQRSQFPRACALVDATAARFGREVVARDGRTLYALEDARSAAR